MRDSADVFDPCQSTVDTTEFLHACLSALQSSPHAHLLSVHAAAVTQTPTDPLPLYDLADLCAENGSRDLWRLGVMLAFDRPHENHESLFRRAEEKLLLGDWSGWTDYEARLFKPGWGCARPSGLTWTHHAWDGVDDLQGRSLLIRRQGGFGDGIFMLRFVPPLSQRVGHIILDVRPELVDLVRHNFGHLATVTSVRGDRLGIEFDSYLWSMSLPNIVGSLPTFVPLTAPTRAAVATRRDRTRQIGVCWGSGATATGEISTRSIPLELLAPLFARADIQLHSLQVGMQASEVRRCPAIAQPEPPLRAFADTASVIAGLDAVITVDTAVCHLAGSLGAPTFALLRYVAALHWGLEDTTPWYPTMRLLRQTQPGDWSSVVDALMAALDS